MAGAVLLGAFAATEAQTPPVQPQDERASLRLVVTAAAGGSFNERETRLPVSPVGFARLSVETWNDINGFDIGMFMGGAATGILVTECGERAECPAGTRFTADFVATGEVGLILGLPGEPYLVGYVGRAFPASADRFNPTASQQDRRYRRYTFGGGGGISPQVGRLTFMIEARWRRDGRLPVGSGDSVEVLVGLPFRSG